MTIHHATIKRAAKLGIDLNETPEGIVVAEYKKGDRQFSHSNVQVALNAVRLSSRFALEYPNILVGGKNTEVTTVTVFHEVDGKTTPLFDFDGREMTDKQCDEYFAKALEMAEDADLDTGEDDEVRYSGTVVAEKYREMYKERGNENHCGDWLAEYLDGMFQVEVDGKTRFDAEAFADFLADNGVELTGKWAALLGSTQAGWQGRFRMNGRQKLEVAVAIRGTVIHGNSEVDVPKKALKELRDKHAVAIAKHEKALAQAEEKEDDDKAA